ncbi:hydroxyisourate hydrolase [Actinomadura macrotermitis]|uniref:5-hydroxyisourate hydrolase n=1 Tax=Actinomadura macrotermitis TaxID=2585200 RepID=A0A7K0BN31_9ACTN|nr:hydroxyisourate hydrolase [Actinomadura macrotermitis]MQY02589.1 5-hydroxyisourate hydrolase [Actinomadura macrotermitis]
MTVSTHVLDQQRGRPAAGLPIRLDRHRGDTWEPLAEGVTGDDGRWTAPAPEGAAPGAPTEQGTYRLRFGSGPYFTGLGSATCYPEIAVVFTVADGGEHHHMPLLLSPFGYSTYRGA